MGRNSGGSGRAPAQRGQWGGHSSARPRCGRPAPPASPAGARRHTAQAPALHTSLSGRQLLPPPGKPEASLRTPLPPGSAAGKSRRRWRGSAGAPRTWAEGGQSPATGSQEHAPRRRHRPGPHGRCHRRARPPKGRHRLRRGRRLARAGGPGTLPGPGAAAALEAAGSAVSGAARSGGRVALGRALG